MLILATTTSSIAPSNVSQSSEYSLAEWLRPTSMLLSSYEISPTERAADITVTFKTTPTPAGYALNIDFYVNDSDDSHLLPGIYYSRKNPALAVPADYPPAHDFPSPILPSLWDNGYLKRYSTKVMFASRVKPKTQYQIFWRIELGEDNQDNGSSPTHNTNAGTATMSSVLFDRGHLHRFLETVRLPQKFPARNIIPTTDPSLAMHCFNSEEYAEVFLPMVSRNQEALR